MQCELRDVLWVDYGFKLCFIINMVCGTNTENEM